MPPVRFTSRPLTVAELLLVRKLGQDGSDMESVINLALLRLAEGEDPNAIFGMPVSDLAETLQVLVKSIEAAAVFTNWSIQWDQADETLHE